MASTVVHVFLQNMNKVMRSHSFACFKESNKDQFQYLYNEILNLSKFIYKVEEKNIEYLELKNLVVQIRDVVLEAENVIDLFIVNAYEAADRGDSDLSVKLDGVKKDLEEIKIVVDQMNSYETISDYFKHQETTTKITAKASTAPEAEAVASGNAAVSTKTDTVVGFDQEIDKIINSFHDEGKPLEIISIVGLPGLGKTTLARKVFGDIRTEEKFPTRAWVTVSQTYSKTGLLIDIMNSLSVFDDEDSRPLGEQLNRYLNDKKYLIVMDDIWCVDAWNDIQRSLPDQCNGSKVIFTSRFTEVGKSTGDQATTHHMSPLSEEHSWSLFQQKVFGNQSSCPPDLEVFGKKIVQKCAGLPLSIVVIGGLLAKNEKTPAWWEQIAQSFGPTVATYREACMNTVVLSYQHLPLHLKACFLYLGMFPEDYEIPLRKVTWSLVAEGFVVQESDQTVEEKSLEVIAEGYLNELAERSLVIVARTRSNGAAKAFQVHDLLRDFCIIKGKQEKFLCQMFDSEKKSSSLHLALYGHRRLYITIPAYQKISSEPSAINLRSLVCFASDRGPPKIGSNLVLHEDHFKRLKVLDLLSISIPFPCEIGNLYHLKFLALWSEVRCLPPSFSKLYNLETFILSTKDTVTLPRDIWKMVKLRHIYNPKGLFHFEKLPSQNDSKLENLQTLCPLCACRTCLKMLERTPGVKKLELRGSLISARGLSTIPDLSRLEQLESLKCTNTGLYSHRSSDIVQLTLPASLKRLTLQKTSLKWKEISALGELESLEVLKLLEDACIVCDNESEAEAEAEAEADWDTCGQEFSQLKYLKMRKLDIIKWDDQELGFQSLEVLVLEECRKLNLLPLDLAQVPTLRMIEVTRCNPSAETCARDIVEEHKQQCGDENLRALIIS